MQSALDRSFDLFTSGRAIQAYEASRALGPLSTWRGARARVYAGRLARELGGAKLSRACFIRVYREHPQDLDAREFFIYETFGRLGPLATYRQIVDGIDLRAATVKQRASWHALLATFYLTVRDFAAAERELCVARDLLPDDAWVWIQFSTLAQRRDQRELALEHATHALQLRATYATGTINKADILRELGRDDEALALLREAAKHIESARLWQSQAAIHTERGNHGAALAAYERCATLLPLMDKRWRQYLSAQRADCAYRLNDLDGAAEFARQVDTPFYIEFSKQLSVPVRDTRRVELPLKFVRQNESTCAPATLTSLASWFDRPAEHLEIASQICYDGTSSFNERTWLQNNNFIVREFTLDRRSAVALLDRQTPFALETRNVISAHLQAICGYDALRGTFLVRDPGDPDRSEFCVKEMLEAFASVGPRAMVAVPADRAELIEGLHLPDAELFDELYAFYAALEAHVRDAAVVALRRMEALSPRHRLTLAARERLAFYDSNQTLALEAAQALLELYPDDNILRMRIVRSLDSLGRQRERLDLLAELVDKPKRSVVFWREYAIDLAADGRRRDEARYWFRRTERRLGFDADTLHAYADFLWDEDRTSAWMLYRWAACLEHKVEWHARSYFRASRHFKQAEEALAWLRERYVEYRQKSCSPAITLVESLVDLDLTREALAVLDEALQFRPDDGHLITFAANHFSEVGQIEKAGALLQRAERLAHRATWLRAASRLADLRGDSAEQLQRCREWASLDPHEVTTHQTIFDLLVPIEGESAAIEYLRSVAHAHPHHLGIQQALLGRLAAVDVQASVALAREILTLHPSDGWTHRELSALYARDGRHEEALASARFAQQVDATNPYSSSFVARFLADLGRRGEARHEHRRALEITVDHIPSIVGMLDCCDTLEQKRESLAIIHSELLRQTTFGEGLFEYFSVALGIVPDDDLLAFARHAVAERSDLWHSHAALLEELTRRKEFDEALEVANGITERFPLIAGSWRQLANLHLARDDRRAEIAALIEVLRINPAWAAVYAQLADAYEAAGDSASARKSLEGAIARLPQKASLRVFLADLLWRTDQKDAAIEPMLTGCRLETNYEWAWNTATKWLRERDELHRLRALTAELVAARPADAHAWLRRGEALEVATRDAPADTDAALAAFDMAVRINPRSIAAHASRCDLLQTTGKLQEALAATRPAAWPNVRPLGLRAREGDLLGLTGDIPGAIRTLQDVVDEEPAYEWSWERLIHWSGQRDDKLAHVAITQRWAAASESAYAWSHVGAAQVDADDIPAAMQSLRRAIELEPENEFAHRRLVSLHTAAGEVDTARQIMDRLRGFARDPWCYVAAIELDLKLRDTSAIIADVRHLARMSTADEELFRHVYSLLKPWKHDRKIRGAIAQLLADPEVNPNFAYAWQAFFGQGVAAYWRLWRAPALTKAWSVAAAIVLDGASTASATLVHLFILRNAEWLRSDITTWANAGYALITHGKASATRRWMSDWRTRTDATSWMLNNVAVACWRNNRIAEAVAIHRHAVTLPDDNIWIIHRTFLASYVLAYEGDFEQALCLLDAPPPLAGQPAVLHPIALHAAKVLMAIKSQNLPTLRTEIAALSSTLRKFRPRLRGNHASRRLVWRMMSRVSTAAGRTWLARWQSLKAWF